ncbi:hypothetical protein PENTCL1PPCAC_18346, partial [Pristionchus entomophagus]
PPLPSLFSPSLHNLLISGGTQMSSPRPSRRSLDSTLRRFSQEVPSSSPSSSQSTSFSPPFSFDGYARWRDSLDPIYSSTSSFYSFDTVSSPPTRWPTSRTPRRRRPLDTANQSILDDTTVSSIDESSVSLDESTVASRSIDSLNDSGFRDDIFHSPPVNKSALSQTSLLRTPTNDLLRQRTANSAFLSSVNSPSPLRSFKIREVSHISSNHTGGTTHMRFTGADVSGSAPVYLGQSDPMLQMKTNQRSYSPTPSARHEIKVETPSKGYEEDDEDSMFSMASSSMMRMRDIPEITSGPIESSLFSFSDSPYLQMEPSHSMDDEEDTCYGEEEDNDSSDEEEEYMPSSSPLLARPQPVLQYCPPSAAAAAANSLTLSGLSRQPLGDLQLNSLKRRAEDGWKSGFEAKKFSHGVRSNFDRPVAQIIAEDVKPDLAHLNVSMAASSSSVGSAAAAAKPKTSFRTPKKPFKAYSKRWWQVCTGSTQEQRTLTSQAHAFLRRYGVDLAPKITAQTTLSEAQSMIIVKDEPFYDTDIHFAPYLNGLDLTNTAPEDPINYQPPPLFSTY